MIVIFIFFRQLDNVERAEKGEWSVRLKFPPYPGNLEGLNWHMINQIHKTNGNVNKSELCNSYKVRKTTTKKHCFMHAFFYSIMDGVH